MQTRTKTLTKTTLQKGKTLLVVSLEHDEAHRNWTRRVVSNDRDMNAELDIETFESAYKRYESDVKAFKKMGYKESKAELYNGLSRPEYIKALIDERIYDSIMDEVHEHAADMASKHQSTEERYERDINRNSSEILGELINYLEEARDRYAEIA